MNQNNTLIKTHQIKKPKLKYFSYDKNQLQRNFDLFQQKIEELKLFGKYSEIKEKCILKITESPLNYYAYFYYGEIDSISARLNDDYLRMKNALNFIKMSIDIYPNWNRAIRYKNLIERELIHMKSKK